MDPKLQEFINNNTIQLYLPVFFLNLVLTGILSWALGWVYRKYGTSLSDRKHFSRNFVLLSMTTMLIISVVKSSLALSLGLVGALSIVRFRSAIKEPEELAYLFFCIAVGIGMGAGQTWAILGAFVVIVPVLVVRSYLSEKDQTENLLLNISGQNDTLTPEKLAEILDMYCRSINLKRLEDHADLLEAVYLIELKTPEDLNRLRHDIKAIGPGIRITFIDQKITA